MKRPDRAVLAVLGLALGLRLVHVLTIRDSPFFDVLPLDSEAYDGWARRILAGDWLRDRPFYQAPLYAYVLAGMHAISGGDLLFPRIVNALLGTLNVALVMRIAGRAFGRTAGIAAGLLAALHAAFLFEEGKVTKTTLGVVLVTGTLALLLEARRREGSALRWYAAAGALGGAAALVRENVLLFVAAAAAWRLARGAPRAAAAICAGAAVAILPALLHNARFHGELLPLTSQAGQNLYTGVHPGNPWGGYLVPDFVRRSPRFEEIDFAKEAERRAGRPMTAGEVSRYWRNESLRVIAGDPVRWLRLGARKLGLLLNDYEIPDDEDLRAFRRWAPVLRLPLPGFGIVATLGLVGLVVALARRRAPGELVLFLAVYPLSVALFFVFSRYRLAMVPPLAVFGGALLAEGLAALRARRWRALALGTAACVPVAAFLFRPLDVTGTTAQAHLSWGIAREVQGRPDEALAEYRAGLALAPDDPKLLRRAANLAADRSPPGDPGALELLRRAVAAAPGDVELRFRLGTARGATGDLRGAIDEFEAILATGAEPPGLRANLAIAWAALGDSARARGHARRALEIDPGDRAMRELAEP